MEILGDMGSSVMLLLAFGLALGLLTQDFGSANREKSLTVGELRALLRQRYRRHQEPPPPTF